MRLQDLRIDGICVLLRVNRESYLVMHDLNLFLLFLRTQMRLCEVNVRLLCMQEMVINISLPPSPPPRNLIRVVA